MSSPPPLPKTQDAESPSRSSWRSKLTPQFCAMINLLAFPGLGSILAGRPSGFPQALLMLTGFFLAVGFMGFYLRDSYRAIASGGATLEFESAQLTWMAWWGFGLCLVAWVWAGLTSLSLLDGRSSRPRGRQDQG